MTTTSERFRPHPQIVFTRVNDSAGILLSLTSNRYYSLNESGMLIWEALASGGGLRHLAAALEAEYVVTTENAEALVVEFLDLLREERLIQPAEAEPG